MGWQLRNGCRWTALAALLWWFCVSSIAIADALQEPNPLQSITSSLQNSIEATYPKSTKDFVQSGEGRSSLWGLPSIRRFCDPSTPECGGSAITKSPYHGGDGDAVADAEVAKREEVKGQQKVSCDVKCFRADPVCGEDAVTYWCGTAEAKCAGVGVAYTGFCDLRSGGAGKDGTRAAQSLFLVHLIWLVLAGILVIADVL